MCVEGNGPRPSNHHETMTITRLFHNPDFSGPRGLTFNTETFQLVWWSKDADTEAMIRRCEQCSDLADGRRAWIHAQDHMERHFWKRGETFTR